MSGVQAKEDIIPGTVEERLLEDELDPDSEIEVELDAEVHVVAVVDGDADVEVDGELDPDVGLDDDDVDIEVTVRGEYIEFELGDNVVYPHHGAEMCIRDRAQLHRHRAHPARAAA